jgi:glycosyltransferase involved in cell wall biosynthesis
MKICLVHNSYEQRGGEDVVFEQEMANLKRHGHEVVAYHRSNTEIKSHSPLAQISLAKNSVWSADSREGFSELLDRHAPDLVHIHNTFFVISPSVYSACRERGIPVVQTLHNFRLICPAHTFYRSDSICEECLTGGLWNSVRHGCYRESRIMTATLATILSWHRLIHTWENSIDCYIALTEFSREKFIAAGFNPAKIVVKPNFVDRDPGPKTDTGDFALYVGRLTPEKGLQALLEAWQQLPASCQLQVVGGGPEKVQLEDLVRSRNVVNIKFRGSLSRPETIALVKQARFLVVPSLWYEGFPMVIAEAMACGTPVVCSQLGAMEEIVTHHRTGLHFIPGDAEDLAQKAAWAWIHPEEMAEMGRAARVEYERRYTAESNYAALMKIYRRVLNAQMPNPRLAGHPGPVPAYAHR